MTHKLPLRWNHFTPKPADNFIALFKTIQHCGDAYQAIENATESVGIVCREIIHLTHHYIEGVDIDINRQDELFFTISNLSTVLTLLKNGKSIWEIISDFAHSEEFNQAQIPFLFELSTRVHQKQDFPLFRKNLLGIAVNLSDIDRLSSISDCVILYKLKETSINPSSLFQTESESIRECYSHYHYCALINCLYLVAEKKQHRNDEQLQSDIAKMSAFLKSVRDTPHNAVTPISELQVDVIRSIIDQSTDLNALQRDKPSQILKNATNTLLDDLLRRYAGITKEAATPAMLS